MALVDENYVDDGGLREQDDVPLEVFLGREDRTQLSSGRGDPFFSGRELEMGVFRGMVNALSRGQQANATLVAEGPPGAGKTALLAQFMEDMRTLPPVGREGRRWLPVPLNGAGAEAPRAIEAAVRNAIAARLGRDLLEAKPGNEHSAAQEFARWLGGDAARTGREALRALARACSERGFGVAGVVQVGGAAQRSDERIEDVAGRCARQWRGWQIVLLVDEAQQISAAVPGAVPGTLSSIHQGLVGAPISFCAFGLPGTWGALADVGVSRGTASHSLPLAGLEGDAPRMAVLRCFEQYGVEDAGDWLLAIVERSGRWPQHLAVYLDAAARTLARHSEPRGALGRVRPELLKPAMDLGDEHRRAYYERRMDGLSRCDGFFSEYANTLVEAVRGSEGAPLLPELLTRIMDTHQLTRDEANRFRREAERVGLFAVGPGGRCSLPIPSFASHLRGEPLPPLPETGPAA